MAFPGQRFVVLLSFNFFTPLQFLHPLSLTIIVREIQSVASELFERAPLQVRREKLQALEMRLKFPNPIRDWEMEGNEFRVTAKWIHFDRHYDSNCFKNKEDRQFKSSSYLPSSARAGRQNDTWCPISVCICGNFVVHGGNKLARQAFVIPGCTFAT